MCNETIIVHHRKTNKKVHHYKTKIKVYKVNMDFQEHWGSETLDKLVK